MKFSVFTILLVSITASLPGVLAEQCGSQAGGALCPGGLCCSKWGYCGNTPLTATTAVRASVPSPPRHRLPSPPRRLPRLPALPGGDGVASIISSALFDEMLKHRNDAACPATGSTSTKPSSRPPTHSSASGRRATSTPASGRSRRSWRRRRTRPPAGGRLPRMDRMRGVTAFWRRWAPLPTTAFRARTITTTARRGSPRSGPAQQPGLGGDGSEDLVRDRTLVLDDPSVAQPSCHDVITDRWTPSAADVSAGRLPGYGVITNIINGGLECGHGPDNRVADRIGFYKRYCDIFGVSYGDNLDCYNQKPFNSGRAVE
uniref:chitinase n=1 Tax=Ananas comosus var. bracteatus TaxID=296719 RepID=A0A6V7NRQ0_ANACO|nr:unnamed protein product [Ananas comosus var. bracteatus]